MPDQQGEDWQEVDELLGHAGSLALTLEQELKRA